MRLENSCFVCTCVLLTLILQSCMSNADQLDSISCKSLTVGIPVNKQTNTSSGDCYVFESDINIVDHVEISLTSFSGDADMFVTLDNDEHYPDAQNADYSSRSYTQHDYVVIRPDDPPVKNKCGNGPCTIRVQVIAYGGSAIFKLVASDPDTPIELENGSPRVDHVLENKYDYFVYTPASTDSKLSFILTTFAGDPDMYVGWSEGVALRPTEGAPATYNWTSTYLTNDVVEIYPHDPLRCKTQCSYTIGITGFGTNSTFGMLVYEDMNDTQIQLLDGRPQSGTVAQHRSVLYSFLASSSVRNIRISVQPWIGDPDLFVNVGETSAPDSMHHNFSSLSSDGIDEIIIDATTAEYSHSCGNKDCLILVSVYGQQDSGYFITVTADQPTELQEGVAQRGSTYGGVANPADYTYFFFKNPNAESKIIFSLTALSGDPDLFVVANDGTARPTIANATWKSMRLGSDVVEIQPGESAGCGNAVGCSYWVGIASAFGKSSFSLIASTSSGRPIILLDGHPVVDYVNESLTNKYSFSIPMNATISDVEFALTPTYGDPDLYIKLGFPNVSLNYYDYKSVQGNGADRIVVNKSDAKFSRSCNDFNDSCPAFLLVHGFQASQYTLLGSTHNAIKQLEEGVAITDDVPSGEYEHFMFRVINQNVTVTITLTSLSGDPDLYVNNSIAGGFPTAGNAMFSSIGIGFESVTIVPTQQANIKCFQNRSVCLYYISVHAFGSHSATFSIQASTGVSMLSSGEPQTGTTAPAHFIYYRFRLPPAASSASRDAYAQLALTRINGDVDVYINNEMDDNGFPIFPVRECDGPLQCTIKNSKWSTVSTLSGNSIEIHQNDNVSSPWTPGQDYIVGVIGSVFSAFQSDFQVTYNYMNGEGIRRLQDGVPVSDSVMLSDFMYYRYEVAGTEDDLYISLTPTTGDPDLYVSINENNTRPTNKPGHYDYRQLSSLNDTLYIPHQAMQTCHDEAKSLGMAGCVVYIGVFGYRAAQYTLLARISDSSPSILVDGSSQAAQVAEGDYAHFVAFVGVSNNTGYTIYMSPSNGDADLFVNTITSGSFPTKEFGHYDFASTTLGEESIEINPNDPRYIDNGIVRISVYGFTASSFIIQYVSQKQVQILQDGVSLQGRVSPGTDEIAYFRFQMPAERTSLTFAINERSGDATFFVSVNKLPTRTTHDFAAADVGDNVLFLSPSTDGFQTDANYYIGVVSSDPYNAEDATFTITVTREGTLTRLVDGAPQSNAVESEKCSYFYVQLSDPTSRNLSISAVPIATSSQGGDVRVVATNVFPFDQWPPAENYLPTLSRNNRWSSSNASAPDRHTVFIPYNDPGVHASLNTYLVGICAIEGNVLFTTAAVTNEMSFVLEPGVATPRLSIGGNSTMQFRLRSTGQFDQLRNNLTVLLTPLRGNADILVSYDSAHGPHCYMEGGVRNCYDTIWATGKDNSKESGPDVLQISNADVCANAFNSSCDAEEVVKADWLQIGVFANSETSFVLSALFQGIVTLRFGEVQTVQSDWYAPAYMMFRVLPSDVQSHLPDIKLTVSRLTEDGSIGLGGMPLEVFISSCLDSACTSANQRPSQSSHSSGGIFYLLGETTDFFLTPEDPIYCIPRTSMSGGCRYYIGAYPVQLLGASTGNTTFQVSVDVLGDNSLTSVPFNNIRDRVSQYAGNVPPRNSKNYEIYLEPELGSKDLTIGVTACDSTFPALYVCLPYPGNEYSKCSDIYSPAPNMYSAKNLTSAYAGSASIIFPHSAQKFVIASVTSSMNRRMLHSATIAPNKLFVRDVHSTHLTEQTLNWFPYSPAQRQQLEHLLVKQKRRHAAALTSRNSGMRHLQSAEQGSEYQFFAYVGPTWILRAPSGAQPAISFDDNLVATVSWPSAEFSLVGTDLTNPPVVPATNVSYAVYSAKGSFAGGAAEKSAAILATTPCGLDRWASLFSQSPSVIRNELEARLNNFDGKQKYEVNIVADCDSACWEATAPALLKAYSGIPFLSQAYSRQRSVYSSLSVDVPANSESKNGAKGAVAWIITVCVVAALGVAGFIIYRYKRKSQTSDQYEVMDNEYSLTTSGRPAKPANNRGPSLLASSDDSAFGDRLAQYMND